MDVVAVDITELENTDELFKLREEIKCKDKELEKLKLELNKASELCQKVIKYNENLKNHLASKSGHNQSTCHVGVQANAEDIDTQVSVPVDAEPLNEDWLVASEKSQMSLTECVREAAEEATRQAGFVYDPSSGYYYDSKSGYYYHPEEALYYDPKTGVYFYYNQETQKYEFHSKIDLSTNRQNENEIPGEIKITEEFPADLEKLEGELNNKSGRESRSSSSRSKRHNDHSPNSSSHRHEEYKADSKSHRARTLSNSDEEGDDWDRNIKEYKREREKSRRNDRDKSRDKLRSKDRSKRSERERSKHHKRSSDKKNRRKSADDDVVVINDIISKEEGECSESSHSDYEGEDRDSSTDSTYSGRRKKRHKIIEDLEYSVNSVEDFEDEINKIGNEVSRFCDDSHEGDKGNFPPCVRAIILETGDAEMKCGSLMLITCQGVVIGKEKTCGICLGDTLVSKSHAEIVYAQRNQCYAVKDLGSVNGTFLNDKMISKTNRHAIEHGDFLTVGKTKLLLHIHKGNETCDECEPGQVQAALAAANPEIKEVQIQSREEKEKERKRELKQLKKKYGLSEEAYVEKAQLLPTNSGYTDRAEVRRVEKGSDNPYEKTEVASVNVAISQESKGFKMLEKMGWSTGQSLGKTQEGILEPIQVDGRLAGNKAGLGSHDDVPYVPKRRKTDQWLKAQERYRMIAPDPPAEDGT